MNHETFTEVDSMRATGSVAVDQHGSKVGKVSDVVYDETGHPEWLFVDRGLLHRERVVPVDGAYRTADGDVVIPMDKSEIMHAPPAPKDHVVTRELEAELQQHFRH